MAAKPLTLLRREIVRRGMGRGRLVSFINVTVFRDLFTFELLRRRIASCGYIRPRAVYYDASSENAPVALQFRLPPTAARQFTQQFWLTGQILS